MAKRKKVCKYYPTVKTERTGSLWATNGERIYTVNSMTVRVGEYYPVSFHGLVHQAEIVGSGGEGAW